MIAAGIGCKRGTAHDDIEAIVLAALAAHNIDCTRLDAIATAASKSDEPGIEAAAQILGVTLVACTEAQLASACDRVITLSARVQALKGVPSIAEASAIVAAGRNARLLGARIATGTATCAIAQGDGP